MKFHLEHGTNGTMWLLELVIEVFAVRDLPQRHRRPNPTSVWNYLDSALSQPAPELWPLLAILSQPVHCLGIVIELAKGSVIVIVDPRE